MRCGNAWLLCAALEVPLAASGRSLFMHASDIDTTSRLKSTFPYRRAASVVLIILNDRKVPFMSTMFPEE